MVFCGLMVPHRMIQAPQPEPRIMRDELTDHEWAAIGQCWKPRAFHG
jgi:hypothetical protein